MNTQAVKTTATELLTNAGFAVQPAVTNGREYLIFESATALGFLFIYETPVELLENWQQDSKRAITDNQLGLRRAGQKAWNTYVVLFSLQPAPYPQAVALAGIEEDLTGTRKIARSGVVDSTDLRDALLPLLPLQAAPQLEAVDIPAEIRQRTSELPPPGVEAFLSTADESVVLQVLEQLL